MGLRTLMIEMYTTGGRVTQLSEPGSYLRLIMEHGDLGFGMLESISDKAMAVMKGYEEKAQSTIQECRAMKSRMLCSRKRKFGQVNTMLDKFGNTGQGDSTVKFEAPERFTTPCAEHSVEPQSHTVAKANGGS